MPRWCKVLLEIVDIANQHWGRVHKDENSPKNCSFHYRYSSPHVCRKLKIQDVVRRYKIDQSIPEFQVSLFGKESK